MTKFLEIRGKSQNIGKSQIFWKISLNRHKNNNNLYSCSSLNEFPKKIDIVLIAHGQMLDQLQCDKDVNLTLEEWNSLSNKEKVLKFLKICKSNILLKGNTTLVGSNNKIIKNLHSSSELAVIGSGDVLAGIITSLVGDDKLSVLEAASAGAWLHGDIAKKYGKGLISEDIVKGIPRALNRLKDGKFVK